MYFETVQTYPDINHGDFAMVLSVGGIAKGISYLLGGLFLVPSLGPRGSLVLASVLYTLSPVLTYVCLIIGARVEVIYLVYGVISSAAFAILLLINMTLPVTWFPQHRGKVIGFISGGFGLSSTGCHCHHNFRICDFLKYFSFFSIASIACESFQYCS